MFDKYLDGEFRVVRPDDTAFVYRLTVLTEEQVEATARLLNSEWPRSLGQRCMSLRSLLASSADTASAHFDFKLPISLILVHKTDSEGVQVIGHSSLNPIVTFAKTQSARPGEDGKQNLIFLQSLIVDKAYRGRGLGRLMMQFSEDYVLRCHDHLKSAARVEASDESATGGVGSVISLANTRFDCLYLTTHDQQRFYESIGYERTEPLSFYSIKSNSSRCNQIMQALLSNMARQNEPEPVASSRQPPKPSQPASDSLPGDGNVTWYKKSLTSKA